MDKRIDLIKVENHSASIYVGLHVRNTGADYTIASAESICQKYCDDTGFCVSVTPTKYVYTKGGEEGVIVGIINYPRFPSDSATLRERTIILATELMLGLEQKFVSIDFANDTVMLTNPYL